MGTSNQYSEKVAIIYEATHEYGDIGDEQFYLDAATTADGPVLEGACGTGRLYLELLRRGIDADGFDISPAMLEILREKATTADLTPNVWNDDLRSIDAERAYALAMVPYNSFCSLTDVDDQIAALEAVHAVLNPGGRLIFDVYVPSYDAIAGTFGEWQEPQEFDYEGETVSGRSRATIANEAKQTYRTEQELLNAEDEVIARDEFVLSHLPPQQVELLARHSPFEQWTVWGGFDRDPLTDGDRVHVWELVK